MSTIMESIGAGATFAYASPGMTETPLTTVSRRKMSIPSRSPSRATFGGPGVVLTFGGVGEIGDLIRIHSVHYAQPKTECDHGVALLADVSPISATPVKQIRVSPSLSRAFVKSRVMDTPPASDEECSDDDTWSQSSSRKRMRKEKCTNFFSFLAFGRF